MNNNINKNSQVYGVVALVRKGERYLLLQERHEILRGFWGPPHGKSDSNDVDESSTVVRETFEETGLKVLPTRKLLDKVADSRVNKVSFWEVNVIGGHLAISEKECMGYGWFTLDEALRLTLYPATREVFETLAHKDSQR